MGATGSTRVTGRDQPPAHGSGAGITVDNAWRAAALLHAITRLHPLSARNALYGAAIVVAYMDAAGEAIDPHYGALIDLARDIGAGRADGYDTADRIRSWRI
ncbi:hypothetical protein ACWD5R_33025 [Streptomyces sp. NPDC002514]|uniref:hypothetical protein n=1 Tax=unclassified Streptomyces TaxID=2593676 RepID=UPI0036866D04